MANIFRGFTNHPTHRERALRETELQIKALSDTVLQDPVLLFQVVAGGPMLWRNTVMREFRGNRLVTPDIPDLLFRGFAQAVVGVHGGEDAVRTASLLLDAIEPVTPPTQKEIDDAWRVDSASSEDGKRHFYGDVAPEEFIKQIVH